METIEGDAVSAPLFLVSALQSCNLCGQENKVVALATKELQAEDGMDDADGFLLGNVEQLPPEILGEILKHHPNYERRSSLSAGDSYLMTVCACGGHHGDHYVHKQLLNQALRSPDDIAVERLPVSGTWVIPCGYSQSISVGALLENAKA